MYSKAPLSVESVFPTVKRHSDQYVRLKWLLGQKCQYCGRLMKDHDFTTTTPDSLPFVCPQVQEAKHVEVSI